MQSSSRFTEAAAKSVIDSQLESISTMVNMSGPYSVRHDVLGEPSPLSMAHSKDAHVRGFFPERSSDP